MYQYTYVIEKGIIITNFSALDAYESLQDNLINEWATECVEAESISIMQAINRKYDKYVTELDITFNMFSSGRAITFGYGEYEVTKSKCEEE